MDIGDRVDSIESGIASNVESAKSLAGSSQVDVSLVVLEVNERLLRSKNIMIFGLPESLMTNPNEKRESDKRNIEAILSSADPNSNSSSLRFFRVGKGSASKPRPLKVIIGCAERVNKILKACTKDVIRGLGPNFSNISLARDKTKQELAHLDHLRKELSRRLKEATNMTDQALFTASEWDRAEQRGFAFPGQQLASGMIRRFIDSFSQARRWMPAVLSIYSRGRCILEG
ncbi:hypothetical protein J6590_101788 [Homalodisca vitripennis]|nr:hypothetical protein J6590_101788 [Homalodisca vitripennis]